MFIFDELPINIFYSIVTYLILSQLFKKYVWSFIDPISISLMTVAFSVGNVTYLYSSDIIEISELFNIFFLMGSFFGIVFLFSLFFNKRDFSRGLNEINNYVDSNDRNRDINLFYIITFISFLLQLYFSSQIISADAGDVRIIIAKENRFMDVLKNGFVFFMLSMGMTKIVFCQEKKYLIIFILYACVVFFSGSKSALLGLVSTYYFLEGVKSHNSNQRKFLTKTVKTVLIAIFSLFIVISYWSGGDLVQATYLLISRIYNAGDVYLYSYVYGDYTQLFGKYDFLSYVLHPFLKIVGLKGYEFPIGAELFGLMGRTVEGYGPNPHLPILALVLSNGNLFYAFLVVAFFATIYGLIAIFLQRIISSQNFKRLTKLYCLNIYLFSLPVMYIDIGMFEISLISISFVFIIIYSIKNIWLLLPQINKNDKPKYLQNF